MADTKGRTKVFISYSRQDAEWLERLRVHLKPLERRHGVEVWSDSDIKPGSKWREEINKALASAKIAVLLISADFIASKFVEENELPPLLRAAKSEGAVILPLILSPSMFARIEELSRFQAVNDPSKPLVGLTKSEQEAILVRLTETIENTLGFSLTDIERRQAIPSQSSGQDTQESDDGKKQEGPGVSRLKTFLRIPLATWAVLILGLAAIIAVYWRFVYKLGPQEFQYTGKVSDAITNKPIHNARIIVEEDQNAPQVQRTDSEGIFHIVLHSAAHSARLRVEADGYEQLKRHVSFSRTGIEPITLNPFAAAPTPALTSTPLPPTPPLPRGTRTPSPHPSASTPTVQRPRCTSEDILLGKCTKPVRRSECASEDILLGKCTK